MEGEKRTAPDADASSRSKEVAMAWNSSLMMLWVNLATRPEKAVWHPHELRYATAKLFLDWEEAMSPDARRQSVSSASNVCRLLEEFMNKFNEEASAPGRNVFTEMHACMRLDMAEACNIFICRLTTEFKRLLQDLESERGVRQPEAVDKDVAIARAAHEAYQESSFFAQPINGAVPGTRV